MKYKNTTLDIKSQYIVIENPDPDLIPNAKPTITFYRTAYATVDGIKLASAISPSPAVLEYDASTANLEFDEIDPITEIPTGNKLKYSDVYKVLKSVFAYATVHQDQKDAQAILEEEAKKQEQIALLQASLGLLNG